MTIPRRADLAPGNPHAVARTKLLAELPHVGEEPVVAPIPTSAHSRKSTHPAFAEYVDCVIEPATAPPRATKRYVDRAHIDDEWDREEFERHDHHRSMGQPIVHRQRQSARRPTAKSALSDLLSGAHQQAAPFAGLIVTAALVAAAGLLFHMMAGNSESNPKLDEFALPGFQVDADVQSLPPDSSAPLAEITPTAPRPTETRALDAESAELTPVNNATQDEPASELSAQFGPPIAEANVEPNAPLGQLSFPLTETPLALEFSKATDPDLEALPEVAERTEAATSEGINR